MNKIKLALIILQDNLLALNHKFNEICSEFTMTFTLFNPSFE